MTALEAEESAATQAPASASSYATRGITKSFSGSVVLRDATVNFEANEIHTLVGENGAGKSTLFKIMAGIYQPDVGELLIDGEPVSGLTPRTAHHRGIYLVPQEPSLMASLSVAENLFVGVLRRRHFTLDWPAMRREASDYLSRVGLEVDPEMKAEELSIAQQQLLECARALVHQCRILLFDEPTSPLTGHEVETLFGVMRALRKQGFTLGFISHRLDEVLELSDKVTVLRDGRVVLEPTTEQVSRDTLVSAMIGHGLSARPQRHSRKSGPAEREVLTVSGLTLRPHFSGIDLVLHAGEVVGLAGLVGSGRTEIAETIFGLRKADEGTVRLDGKLLGHRTPRSCIDAGIIYLTEDRKRHGIFPEVNVTRNVTAGIIPLLPRVWKLLKPAPERKIAKDATDKTDVRMSSSDSLIDSLSGGNQQRVMFSRWLVATPRVAIFDEPTRGIDVGAKDDVYQLIEELAKGGLACLLISSELSELTVTCDRVLAIYEGEIVGELAGEEITDTRVATLALGEVAK